MIIFVFNKNHLEYIIINNKQLHNKMKDSLVLNIDIIFYIIFIKIYHIIYLDKSIVACNISSWFGLLSK